MSYDFQIFNETFKPNLLLGDSSALTFGWRPGSELRSSLVSNCLIDGSNCRKGLSLSFVFNMSFKGCEFIGGSEDCVDIVRGGNVSFEQCRFVSNKSRRHVAVGGGANGVTFKDCVFVGNCLLAWHGACIELGNWTDYDRVPRPPVRRVSVEGCKMEGSRRRFMCRRAFSMDPDMENSDGGLFRIPVLLVRAFWFLKRKGWLARGKKLPPSLLKVYDIES